MLLELLHFVLGSFWRFLGTIILIGVSSNAVVAIIRGIVAAVSLPFQRGHRPATIKAEVIDAEIVEIEPELH